MKMAAAEAGGAGAIKWVAGFIGIGSLAAAITFVFFPPKTPKEFVSRLFVTLVCSAIYGSVFFFWFSAKFPDITALAVAELTGSQIYVPLVGWWVVTSAQAKFMVASPFLVTGGLPGWYGLGIIMRTLEHFKDKNVGQIIAEVKGWLTGWFK